MSRIQEMFMVLKRGLHDIAMHMDTLAMLSPGKRVVELGCRSGNSTVSFLNGKPLWMKSYDNWSETTTPPASIIQIHENAKLEGIDHELITANDLEIEIPECDILFIDTLHIDWQLELELELHAKKAKEMIVLHDTVTFGFFPEGEGQRYRGMGFALVHFLEKNPQWFISEHYLYNNGLMILKRKTDGSWAY